MSRKSMITIIIGLLVFAATLVISNLIFNTTTPSSAEIMASPQMQVEKLQRVETIHTTFLFMAVLEIMIAGALAFQWRESGIPHQPNAGDHEQSQKETSSTLVRFSVFTGIIAFAASYVSSLLDVFVFDGYGGLNSNTLTCLGVPAGLFGILGGIVWYRIKRKSKFAPIDLIPLILIGIVAGIIPGACIKMLPQ